MANYSYVIYSRDLPPYVRNFDFSTSGEMVSHVEGMVVSGDVYQKTENGETTYHRTPGDSINKIKVTLP